MERLRAIWGTILTQLAALTATQRLLIASLVVVMLMTLFLVSQYAGSAKMVEVAPGLTAEEQRTAVAHLEASGVETRLIGGKVMVAAERQYTALARLSSAGALPRDKKLMFEGLVGQQNWLMPQSQLAVMNTRALCNELAAVIKNFPGIEDASVFISNPEARGVGGIGTAARKPVAQVTVFPRSGSIGLDQGTVNALADLVAGSTSGLEAREVAIIDGTSKRSYRAVSPEDMLWGGGGGGTYMEHVTRVEDRVRGKIEAAIDYIDGVKVAVNAMVDASKRNTREVRVLNKGDGTVVLPVEETTTTSTATNTSKARPAEPGLGSNVTMDINVAGAGGGGPQGMQTSDETTTVKSEARFGEKVITQAEASGRPTKINVIVSVPREYVAEVVKQRKGKKEGGDAKDEGEATEQEILAEWDTGATAAGGLRAKLEEMLQPLVETESSNGGGGASGNAAVQITSGTVKAVLIPVAMGLGGRSGGGGGGGNGNSGAAGASNSGFMNAVSSTLGGGGIVKTVALGGLAVLAIGLMLVMVKRSTRTGALPTAEELVGLPPALETGSDIVGEAEEGETAMTGIEVDASSLKTGKMLEEISTLVSSNPASAAQVFNRWLSSDN